MNAKAIYLDLFETLREALAFEEQVLSIGSDFLPPAALKVRDGGEPTEAYWQWMIAQAGGVE